MRERKKALKAAIATLAILISRAAQATDGIFPSVVFSVIYSFGPT
jgi:hypothetical protein